MVTITSPFPWPLPLLILLIPAALVTSQSPVYFCSQMGADINITNLNTLLSSFSSTMTKSGFLHDYKGQGSNRVNAMAVCRADTRLDSCRSCVQNAVDQLPKLCPNQKQAIMWAELCMFQYSNEVILGVLDNSPLIITRNTSVTTNSEVFQKSLRSLMVDLGGEASYESRPRKVAVGVESVPRSNEEIYGLVQCTPDMSDEDCSNCLTEKFQFLQAVLGMTMYSPSCCIRFEMYKFFDSTALPNERLPSPGPAAGKGEDRYQITIIILLIVLCSIVVIFGGILLRNKAKLRRMKKLQNVDGINMNNMAESIRYDFGTIREATNNFADANKLGRGGFGVVYLGTLSDGQKIAVKRLSKDSKQGDLEFENEVSLVAKLQHRNLIRLLGFSTEGGERLLIYEFVQNASLDRFIFGSTRRSAFDWDTRFNIIRGVARGILYLHEDSCVRIIHRDLKASNILLDGEMNPKIGDFGMAWLFVPDETRSTKNPIVGTYGYMAPEYIMKGQFSIKSDVFSFGVLILEIISGQKNNILQQGEDREGLLSFAWRNWCEGTTVNIIDPMMRTRSDSLRDIVGCIHIALLCVQDNASDRPTMAVVISMLNALSITLPLPSHPAFLAPGSIASILKDHNSKELISRSSTCNGSVSELYPR